MIYVIGEALIDMLQEETSSGETAFVPHTGGSPFNTCIALSRIGVSTGFLGRISSDFFGQMLFEELDKNGVDLSFTQRGEEPTTLGFVKTVPGEDPRYAFYTSGTTDCSLESSKIPKIFPHELDALVFGSISLLMEPGASVITNLVKREVGTRVLSFDPNIRPVLIKNPENYRQRCEELFKLSTIVKISDVDLEWLYPDLSVLDAALTVKALGPVIVGVTMGEKGSFALKGSDRIDSDGVKVEVSDTVGAGDTFHAGFLAWLSNHGLLNLPSLEMLKTGDLKQALDFAGRCAAVTCSRPGADPPYADELGL